MTTMYDAGIGNADKIPSDAQMVAGGGKWTTALFDQWPTAQHVTIAETADDFDKDVIDFERKFLFSAPGLRKWVKGHQALGKGSGVVYVGHQNLWIVKLALAGIPNKPSLWVAHQTGQPHMYMVPGWNVAGTQWYGSRESSWNGVDISEVTDPSAFGDSTIIPKPPGPVPVRSSPAGTIYATTVPVVQHKSHAWIYIIIGIVIVTTIYIVSRRKKQENEEVI